MNEKKMVFPQPNKIPGDQAQKGKNPGVDVEKEELEQERKRLWEIYEQRANDLRQALVEVSTDLKDKETFPGDNAYLAMAELLWSQPDAHDQMIEGLLLGYKFSADRFEQTYKEGVTKGKKPQEEGEQHQEERKNSGGVIKTINTLRDTIGNIFKHNTSEGESISKEEFINNFVQEIKGTCQTALNAAENNIKRYKSGEYYKEPDKVDYGLYD